MSHNLCLLTRARHLRRRLQGREFSPVTRVVLVDDHKILREGLRLVLGEQPDLEMVGQAADTDSGWDVVMRLQPEVVIMDLGLPGDGGGLALTRRIVAAYPNTKVIVLSGHLENSIIHTAIQAGAAAYVVKTDAPEEIVAAIRSALTGQIYLSPGASTLVMRQAQASTTRPKLSPRELEVLRRIAEGEPTKQIAFALGVSTKTVETHRSNLFSKLGVSSVAELTKYAIRHGLTDL